MSKVGLVLILVGIYPGIAHADYNRRLEALQLYQEGLFQETGTGDLKLAKQLYSVVWEKYNDYRDLAAVTLYHLGQVSEKLGQPAEAEKYINMITTNYVDQKEILNRVEMRKRGELPLEQQSFPPRVYLAAMRAKLNMNDYSKEMAQTIENVLKQLATSEDSMTEPIELSPQAREQVRQAYFIIWEKCKDSQEVAAKILYCLGWLYEQEGKYQEAAKYYRMIWLEYKNYNSLAKQAAARYRRYQAEMAKPQSK